MSKEKTLLLDVVDLKNMFKIKTELKKTNSWESHDSKRKQVGENIIDNAWVLYNKIMDNKINEEIENKIKYIYSIESNDNNENEAVTVQVELGRNTCKDFSEYVISKYDHYIFMDKELNDILKKITREYFEKQQQSTTTILEFKGRKPNKFALDRLKKIAYELKQYQSVTFSRTELEKIVKEVLDKPDPRTLKNYMNCLATYAKNKDGITSGWNKVTYNLRGFPELVEKYSQENFEKMLKNDQD